MKRIGLLAFCLWMALAPGANAGPVERELGQGLLFYRVQQLPADLPQPTLADSKPAPCIVDVRYAKAERDAASAFAEWLKVRARPKAPVFVLANAETASALLRVLEGREKSTNVVVIGGTARNFDPDLAIQIPADDERRAYDALENGAAIASLITDNPGKVRNDEASLSRDRLAEASADTAADALAPKRDAPPVDLALQRAVHLHRALVALRKL